MRLSADRVRVLELMGQRTMLMAEGKHAEANAITKRLAVLNGGNLKTLAKDYSR